MVPKCTQNGHFWHIQSDVTVKIDAVGAHRRKIGRGNPRDMERGNPSDIGRGSPREMERGSPREWLEPTFLESNGFKSLEYVAGAIAIPDRIPVVTHGHRAGGRARAKKNSFAGPEYQNSINLKMTNWSKLKQTVDRSVLPTPSFSILHMKARRQSFAATQFKH